jgi:hypothetical protein
MNGYLTFVLVGLVWGLLVLLLAKRMQAQSPRQRKRGSRKRMAWLSLPFGLLVATVMLTLRPVTISAVACSAAILLSVGFSARHAFREEYSESEALTNYAKDPIHCGQCEYDLTGNVSGVCPECGWRMPDPANPSRQEVPLTAWSAFRRIDYLENWPKAFGQALGSAGMSAGLAVAMWVWWRNPLIAAMAGFMFVVVLVRAIRVLAYGRRLARDKRAG